MANSSVEDYYLFLGVPDFAELECVREAYKKLALLLHPDKNPSSTATEDFQKLGIAWETLRDPVKRAEYDRTLAKIKRKRNRSREGDHSRPNQNSRPPKRARKSDESLHDEERRENIREFKEFAKNDYLSRFIVWAEYRDAHVTRIHDCRDTLRQQEHALEEQTPEDDSEILRKFSEAIERHPGQHGQNRSGTLAKLVEGRRSYIANLSMQIKETRICLDRLISELEERTRLYEEDERRAREARIREAIVLAGVRDIKGRNDRAINSWNALSRVKTAKNYSRSWICKEVWHRAGEWERVNGEHDCSRCGQSAYHIIPDCGPAKCPHCSVIVCNVCCRDMNLLRELEGWLLGPDPSYSIFSLEISGSSSCDSGRVPGNNFGISKSYDDEV